MTPEQIAEAERLAREWTPVQPPEGHCRAVDALVEAGYERGHARWWVGKWHDQLNRR